MARSASASSDLLDFAGYPSGFWTYGSWFLAVNITGGASTFRYQGHSGDNYLLGINDSNQLDLYQGGPSSQLTTPTVNTTDGWRIIGMSKATGTATPRFHIYIWSTNAWTHANGNSAIGDATASTTLRVFNDSSSEIVPSNLAAWGMVHGRVLTDSEFERLPSGRWDLIPADVLIEFPSGRDFPVTGTTARHRDNGKYRQTTTTVSGTTRSAATDPPGFKFSRLKQRR